MARICVLYPNCSKESAQELAQKMGWDAVNPFQEARRDFRMYDGVFNYGCNRTIYARNVVNKTPAVATCINKVATFEAFKKAGVPTVDYRTSKETVPAVWDCVVIRQKVDGNKAEGLSYHYQDDRAFMNPNLNVPYGALFTEGFDHEYELRVVVFCGHVVACYKKDDNNGDWDFNPFNIPDNLSKDAIRAATTLDIDYVGFDVLVDNKGSYVFLEANSGPVLTEDVVEAIQGYIK